ncbi:histidine kinase [Flavobacterium sp.]|uniref:sensor histidine kinase n=1 Tax=Flavobacterium sp. TaxID=239 RepID=UPI00286B8BD8|nr:histidine kinase [Flavobacterium sp.]
MINNKYFFKLLIVLFVSVFPKITFAQEECNCEILSNNIKENIVDDKDSLEVFKNINLLKKSKFKSCVFEGFQIEFDYYISNRNSKKGYYVLQKQQNLLKKMNCKGQFDSAIYSNKAYYYKIINDLEKLSFYAFKSLKVAEKSNNPEKQIQAIQALVYLFTKMNEHDKNWIYIKRAQKLIEVQNASKQNVRNYRWLAFEYESKYTLIKRKTLLDSALIFANKSKIGAFRYKMYNEITNFYRVKEACSYHKGDVKNALKHIDSAIFFAKKVKGNKNMAPLYSAKAWDHLDNGQLAEANKWMDTALVVVDNSKDSAGKMMMYFDSSNLYSSTGNISKSFESFKIYTKMKDSVWNIKKVEKVNELEQKYNKAKNEKMIFELEKTKQLYTFLIIGGVLALLALIFFFRQRTLQNKQKIMQTEQRLNRARINPHFFFNAMASLQNLSLQEKSTKTTLFISRFAKIMRQSLESTYEELVSVESEIDFITQYLEIQKLRFPSKFDYQFHVDDTLEINELKIPGMIIQPFVENAIEHGFKDVDYKGKIDITFAENGDQINIIINDNGSGHNLEKKDIKHKSRAMQIIKDRLYLFNKQNGSNASYHVQDSNGTNGFIIIVSLPKTY